MKEIKLDLEDDIYQVLQENANKLEIIINDYILKIFTDILKEKKFMT
jgi:hypothetical protein